MATEHDVLDRLERMLEDGAKEGGIAYLAAGHALRDAAPALIRLARGAMEMVGCAERAEKGEDISQAQVDAMGAEIEAAAKALAEVRL